MRQQTLTAAVARAERSLAELAQAINAEHEAGEVAQGEALQRYRAAGEALLEAKKKVPHGQWLAWLKANVRCTERQAQRYMELAKNDVTSHLAEEWRRISGNAPEEEAPSPAPVPPALAPMVGAPFPAMPAIAAPPAPPVPPSAPESPAPASAVALPVVAAESRAAPAPGLFTGQAGMGEYVTLDVWQRMGEADRADALSARPSDKKFNDQGDNENIEWALWSWNPVTGCRHNCPYCYARDIANRFYEPKFEPSLWPARLSAPFNTPFPEEKAAQWMGHRNVFTCSMADLFGRWVPSEWIEAVLGVVRRAPRWNFLFLSKFPQRMADFDFPRNAWVGTSVDCQARVANAEKAFRKIRAAVKWLSCEPLIEPLKFNDIGAFNWVVIGGASRSSQTPEWVPPMRWVLGIAEQAAQAGVFVYQKTNIRIRQYPVGDFRGMPGITVTQAPDAIRYLPER